MRAGTRVRALAVGAVVAGATTVGYVSAQAAAPAPTAVPAARPAAQPTDHGHGTHDGGERPEVGAPVDEGRGPGSAPTRGQEARRGAAPFGILTAAGPLRDLAPAVQGPLDGARAILLGSASDTDTGFLLRVEGADPAAAGRRLGAHVHVGPCVAGDGAAALGHYSTGGTPSPTTEVWLDLTLSPSGTGVATATVPFRVPAGGARSVVLHEKPTDPAGAAGGRLACLPVTVR